MIRTSLSIQSATAHQFAPIPARALLDFDCSASFRELLLDVLGFFLVYAFLDRLWSAINQVLRFFQAETGDFAYSLDDIDRIGADRGENDGELRLLLRSRRCSSRC